MVVVRSEQHNRALIKFRTQTLSDGRAVNVQAQVLFMHAHYNAVKQEDFDLGEAGKIH